MKTKYLKVLMPKLRKKTIFKKTGKHNNSMIFNHSRTKIIQGKTGYKTRLWFSGRIRPCQGRDPGSIPGSRITAGSVNTLAIEQKGHISFANVLVDTPYVSRLRRVGNI